MSERLYDIISGEQEDNIFYLQVNKTQNMCKF